MDFFLKERKLLGGVAGLAEERGQGQPSNGKRIQMSTMKVDTRKLAQPSWIFVFNEGSFFGVILEFPYIRMKKKKKDPKKMIVQKNQFK